MIKLENDSGRAKLSWSEQRAKLINLYPVLSESDFTYDIGKKDLMLNKVATKIGKTRDDLENILTTL